MIWKIILIISLNFSRASTKIPVHSSTNQNIVQPSPKNLFFEYSTSMIDSSKNSDRVIKKSKNHKAVLSKLSLNSSRSRFIDTATITPKRMINQTVIIRGKQTTMNDESKLPHLVESWLSNINCTNDWSHICELNSSKITSKWRHNGEIRLLQLWKNIRRDLDGENFTLINTSMHVYDLYASNSSHLTGSNQQEPKMKEVLVRDERYTSFMEKWITNRRGRNFAINSTTWAKNNESDVMNSTILRDACASYFNESKNFHDLTNSSREILCSCLNDNYTLNNASKFAIHCGTNAKNASQNVQSKENEDLQAKVYDPLMPYPEEYPEEYQTIQNGPALIISRTTYTRIPNVTYTTITIVTLPTYRLVQKAEDGFAATLFDERRSSAKSYSSNGCKEFS